MKFFVRAISVCLAVLSITSCAPRGENNSVAQVLQIQSSRFADARSGVKLEPQVEQVLAKVESQLQVIIKGDSLGATDQVTEDIADQLGQLITHAGYTSRPALDEIAAEFRALSDSGPDSGPMVKLLAARTYSILTAELQGMKFAVS